MRNTMYKIVMFGHRYLVVKFHFERQWLETVFNSNNLGGTDSRYTLMLVNTAEHS